MSQIPPIVFILIGGTVAAVSWFKPSLKFFFYVGLGIAAYGLLRQIWKWIIAPRKQKESNIQSQTALHANHSSAKIAHNHYPKCPHCAKHVHATFGYCPYCGQRLR